MSSVPELALRQRISDLKLSTRNISKLVESIEEDEYIYLVSKWMNKRDLCYFIKNQQFEYLISDEIRRPLKNIISALKVIHKCGFLHNDV